MQKIFAIIIIILSVNIIFCTNKNQNNINNQAAANPDNKSESSKSGDTMKFNPDNSYNNSIIIQPDFNFEHIPCLDDICDVFLGITDAGLSDYSISKMRTAKKILIEIPGCIEFEPASFSDIENNINIQAEHDENSCKISISLSENKRIEPAVFNGKHGFRVFAVNSDNPLLPDQPEIRQFSKDTVSVDLHNDTIFHMWAYGKDFTSDNSLQINLPKLRQAGVNIIIMAVWIHDYFSQFKRQESNAFPVFAYFNEYLGRDFELAEFAINKIHNLVAENPEDLMLIENPSDCQVAVNQNKIGIIISLEGMHPLGMDPENINYFYDIGLRNAGICWNNTNAFADAIPYGEQLHNGLSLIGRDLINLLVEKKMLIDLSHSSDETAQQILELVREDYPVIATHSNVRAAQGNPRNLPDELILEIARHNGIIGVVYHSGFISNHPGRASLSELIDHIDYISDLAGTRIIALGSDFDGMITSPVDLEDISKLDNLAVALYNRGYTKDEIEGIWGKNFIRVWESTL